MKTRFFTVKVLLLATFIINVQILTAQDLENQGVVKTIHVSKDNFPKGNAVNLLKGWGNMVVAINEPPAGTDFTPLLKNQKDGLCQVPHWGYLEKGKLKVTHKDKSKTIISAGDVFFMPPGHTAIVMEDARIIDFSPEKPMLDLVNDINTILAAKKEELQGN